jgi:hypothetical protein
MQKEEIESIVDMLMSSFHESKEVGLALVENSNPNLAESLLYARLNEQVCKKYQTDVEVFAKGILSFRRIFLIAFDKGLITKRFKTIFKVIVDKHYGVEHFILNYKNPNTSDKLFNEFLQEL